MVDTIRFARTLVDALGEDGSFSMEKLLAQMGHDDVLRSELFGLLVDTRNGLDAMERLWEAFGPGPRKTHYPNGRTHSGQPFRARIRWIDTLTGVRRGNLRAALRSIINNDKTGSADDAPGHQHGLAEPMDPVDVRLAKNGRIRSTQVKWTTGKPVVKSTVDNWRNRGLLIEGQRKKLKSLVEGNDRTHDAAEVELFVAASEAHKRASSSPLKTR